MGEELISFGFDSMTTAHHISWTSFILISFQGATHGSDGPSAAGWLHLHAVYMCLRGSAEDDVRRMM